LTYEEAFTITITNVNEDPTDLALSATSINENVAANATVGTLSTTDPDAANTFTYTLVTGTGDTDNTSFNISGSNLRITNSPNVETKSSYTVRIRTTDQGSLTYEEAFTITITNVNEDPTDLALSATSVNHGVPGNTVIGAFTTTDPDAGNTFTYTLIAGTGDTDNGSFNISGSNLRITNSPDYQVKNSYTIRVRTTDQGGLIYDKAFAITILEVNLAPTDLGLSATSINENVPANSIIGTFSTTDPNGANTFTYTLVAGAGSTDNASFNVIGNSLRITGSPNFEAKSSYSVRIRTTDQGSLTYDEAFNITINNLNEDPTDLLLSSASINENVAASSTVGILSTTDPDAATTFAYTLVAGTGDTDNASFNISGDNLMITISPDFETKSSYSVRIRTTDQGTLTYEEAFIITVNNLNEAPADLALSATSINENVPANSTVGTLSTTDIDAANTFTYTLVPGTGDANNAFFNISGASLRITNSPDFESESSYSIRIRTADQGSLSFEKQFTITITDVVEAVLPTVTTSNVTTASSATATLGGAVTSDGGASVTETGVVYNSIGTPTTSDSRVQIGAGTGAFSKSVSGLVASTTYFVRAYAINQAGIAYGNQISFITTTDVPLNSNPSDISLSNTAVDENADENSIIGIFSSSDPNAGDAFAYLLVSGAGDADNASFTIEGDNLYIISLPDFERQSSYTIRVRTTDEGGLSFEKSFTITVNDISEDIPNVLFPNGSVRNRTWGISHLGIQGKVRINVLDSNGHVVFSTDDPLSEWDGTNGGKRVPEDVYFYSITLSNGNKFQGSLQVIY
jgi:gliding motility-associated-like protein